MSTITDQITDYDRRVLSLLRELWMQAVPGAEKEKLRVRLDDALDERLNLMRERDAVPSVP